MIDLNACDILDTFDTKDYNATLTLWGEVNEDGIQDYFFTAMGPGGITEPQMVTLGDWEDAKERHA